MKAYLVCDDDLGCVTALAETASKARYEGSKEMGATPFFFEEVMRCRVHRIPKYDDCQTDLELHNRYYDDHDPETGWPVGEDHSDEW